MAPKRNFDVELAALEALRDASPQTAETELAKTLSLRAELASDDPELLGACYSGVLAVEGASAVPWVARFLSPEDDTAAEAALAIAQTRTLEAVALLRAAFDKARDPWFRATVLTAL